jgi:purine-cytosine permease-like protein
MTATVDDRPDGPDGPGGGGGSVLVEDEAFRVEQRGIDYIPVAARWATPRDLFGMWAGASINFEYLVYGAVLMTFGFTFAQAVLLILVGNLSYLLLGVCSLQGPTAGTTVFMINRASFGPNGSRLIAFFNWATQVGFETEGLILIVFGAVALAAKAGIHAGVPLKVGLIIGAGVVQGILPFLGYATVVKVMRALILPFLALYVILAVLTLGKANPGSIHHGASWQTMMGGLAFSIALSGLGWVESGNDFSRYLPPDASRKGIIGWVFVATAIPQAALMLLGAAVATYVSIDSKDPFNSFPHAFSGWFLVPFLVVALVQLFAINSMDIYSSGVTLQALGLPVRRWNAVLIDTVIGVGITAYAVFSAGFSRLLSDFVAAVIAWIAPWMAIFLVDWLLRRQRYVPSELQRTDSGGLYWRRGGVNWRALVAQALGTTASVLAFSQSFYVGPIANAFGGGGADFSIFTGVLVGGSVYYVLSRVTVRKEADGQDRFLLRGED